MASGSMRSMALFAAEASASALASRPAAGESGDPSRAAARIRPAVPLPEAKSRSDAVSSWSESVEPYWLVATSSSRCASSITSRRNGGSACVAPAAAVSSSAWLTTTTCAAAACWRARTRKQDPSRTYSHCRERQSLESAESASHAARSSKGM